MHLRLFGQSEYPPGYFELLETKVPEALLVFAYYCAILYIMSSTWWTKGWPRPMIEAVAEVLDPKWGPLLHWPLSLVLRSPASVENTILSPILPASIVYRPRSL